MYLYSQTTKYDNNYLIFELDKKVFQDIKNIADNIDTKIWHITPYTHGLTVFISAEDEMAKEGVDIDQLISEFGDENEPMFVTDLLPKNAEKVNTTISISRNWFNVSVEDCIGGYTTSVDVYFETIMEAFFKLTN